MCVFFPFILDMKFVGRTSRGFFRVGNQYAECEKQQQQQTTQEEGHTGFLIYLPSVVRALIFIARKIQPFLSLVDREVDFYFVY